MDCKAWACHARPLVVRPVKRHRRDARGIEPSGTPLCVEVPDWKEDNDLDLLGASSSDSESGGDVLYVSKLRLEALLQQVSQATG